MGKTTTIYNAGASTPASDATIGIRFNEQNSNAQTVSYLKEWAYMIDHRQVKAVENNDIIGKTAKEVLGLLGIVENEEFRVPENWVVTGYSVNIGNYFDGF